MKVILKALAVITTIGVFSSVQAATNITVASASSARPSCPVMSDGSIGELEFDDDSRPFLLRCVGDIQTLQMDLLKVGLCRSVPDETNPTVDWAEKCVFILDGTTSPVNVQLSLSEPQTINNIDLSKLTEDSYTHAVVMTTNDWAFKFKQQFSQNFQGRTSVGDLCYTIENASYNKFDTSSLSDLSVECVSSETEIVAKGNYGWMHNFTTWIGSAEPSKTLATGNKLFLMSDFNTLATIDNSNKTSNANYEAYIIYFSTPKVIDGNTKNIDLGFAMSDYGRYEFSTRGPCQDSVRASGTEGCINALKSNDFDLRVEAN